MVKLEGKNNEAKILLFFFPLDLFCKQQNEGTIEIAKGPAAVKKNIRILKELLIDGEARPLTFLNMKIAQFFLCAMCKEDYDKIF